MGFGSLLFLAGQEDLKELSDRIVELVRNAFLERNNRVIRDRDVFRADLGTTFGDIAIPEPQVVLQQAKSITHIKRMHFNGSGTDEKPGSCE